MACRKEAQQGEGQGQQLPGPLGESIRHPGVLVDPECGRGGCLVRQGRPSEQPPRGDSEGQRESGSILGGLGPAIGDGVGWDLDCLDGRSRCRRG